MTRSGALLSLVFALCACAPEAKPASAPPSPPAAPTPRGVGVITLQGRDPLTNAPLPLAFFYPSKNAPPDAVTEVGSYRIQAARNAPLADGRFPLVVVSHGHQGSMWGHHDLCEALARHGYVVGAAEHIGDSFRDQSAFGTDRMLLGRAYQASTVIDTALADPAIGPHVDPARIGTAGFSAGGYTSLLLLGAKPDFTRLAGYCQRHPKDAEFCSHGEVEKTVASPRPTADPRVRAAFVMAPLGVFFGPDAFDAVKAPVFLYWATADEVLPPAENAQTVEHGLRTLVESRPVKGAGHFVFLPPCNPELVSSFPDLCRDPPGVDRAALHAKLAEDAKAFFDSKL